MGKRPWIFAVSAIGIQLVLIVIFWSRLGADFWPPDRSFDSPNLLASAIITVNLLVWAGFKLVPRMLEHERKVHELHEKLVVHAAHATKAPEDSLSS